MTSTDPPKLWFNGPWTDAYLYRKSIGNGGQGYTFRALSPTHNRDVAVKVLRPDRDTPKARRRMAREVNALRLLSKTQALVPQFINSNIEDAIENSSVRPYVAMEFVPGSTLQEAQQTRGPMSLADAIKLTNQLLKTIEIAHAEQTAHRDIKPQNIILKNGDYDLPYLIDFGLSFNRVQDLDDGLTSIRESIGNRFLTLPESEQTGSDLKHEFATDLTLLSGVLFFLISNKFPEYLSPDQAKSPQQRYQKEIETVHGESAFFLSQFFSRAFQYDVVRRFQSPNELQDRLHRLKEQSEGRLPYIDPVGVAMEVRDRVASENRVFQLDELERKHQGVLSEFTKYLKKTASEKGIAPISLDFQVDGFGDRKFNGQEVIRHSICRINLSMPQYYAKVFVCRYFLAIHGDEISVMFQESQATTVEEKRRLSGAISAASAVSIFNFYNWDNTHTEELKRHFSNWFHRVTNLLTT